MQRPLDKVGMRGWRYREMPSEVDSNQEWRHIFSSPGCRDNTLGETRHDSRSRMHLKVEK